MERKIGEIFKLDSEWYQCIGSDSCGECSLFTTECGSGTKSDLADKVAGQCSKIRRTDNKHVIFKKIEKVGEHYKNNDRTYQLYKLPLNIEKLPPHTEGITLVRVDIVEIEIKQKDMEEKKLNLKPFDIQKAREGKPICTRDGRKARIICFNRESIGFPIIALIKNGDTEGVYQFDDKGRSNIDDEERGYDLMMLPEKKEGWVNVYKDGLLGTRVYNTKKEAFDNASPSDYLDTVKIGWEE